MKYSLLALVAVVSIAACSKDSAPLKEGWTTENITTKKTECVSTLRTAGDTEEVAQRYCDCVYTKVPIQFTFEEFSKPSTEIAAKLDVVQTECNSGL
jgi:hypothetical protein